MDIGSSCKSATRISLEGELEKWFGRQGVSKEGASRAVQLLDANTLLAQPRPSRWNRRGTFGVQERCRYLWYRHAARILGWCERRRFPDIVTGILRQHIFPTQGERDETTREDGEGRVSTAARAGPAVVDRDHRSAGESFVILISPCFCLGLGVRGGHGRKRKIAIADFDKRSPIFCQLLHLSVNELL